MDLADRYLNTQCVRPRIPAARLQQGAAVPQGTRCLRPFLPELGQFWSEFDECGGANSTSSGRNWPSVARVFSELLANVAGSGASWTDLRRLRPISAGEIGQVWRQVWTNVWRTWPSLTRCRPFVRSYWLLLTGIRQIWGELCKCWHGHDQMFGDNGQFCCEFDRCSASLVVSDRRANIFENGDWRKWSRVGRQNARSTLLTPLLASPSGF